MRNDMCDKCGHRYDMVGPIRRLNTGGGSGIFLCRRCWKDEMKWRTAVNKGRNLKGSARFPILKFPTTKRGPSYAKVLHKVSDALHARAQRGK